MSDPSYTEAYHPHRDGLADLALPSELKEQLRDAMDEPGSTVAQQVAEAITVQIQHHGVNTETGEWCGDWSAEQIVRAVLARQTLFLPSTLEDWAAIPGARVRVQAMGDRQPGEARPVLSYDLIPVSEISGGKGVLVDLPAGTTGLWLHVDLGRDA